MTRRERDRLRTWAENRKAQTHSAEEARRLAYEEYLASPQWARIRQLVINRAGGLCECCLQRLAVQVHHLTYEHFQDERAWELKAVCLECHERVHNDVRY